MRVAIVSEFCPPYRTGFYEAFADRFESKVFFCNTKESWRAFGQFPYLELSNYELRDRYAVAPGVFGALREYNPDVIVGSPVEGFGGQASYLYARVTGTPFVLWTGEWHLPLTTLRTTTFPLVSRIYEGADAIAVYGPHIEHYLADLGVDRDKVSVAWNTVDTTKFASSERDPGELRRELGIPSDSPIALFVGRMIESKGVRYLIDAFKAVRWRTDAEPHLLLVGDGDDYDAFKRQAEDVPNTTLTGYVDNDDLPAYYALADCFVLPSVQTAIFREPWGLVVNEAMSSGTPVIATGQVGAAAAGVVEDGVNGYVVPERNARALADRLASLLDDSEKAATFGNRARERIREFDYERMVDGMAEAIETAVKR
ncbi:glycosyltransferase family 4 protein [Halolamina salina]